MKKQTDELYNILDLESVISKPIPAGNITFDIDIKEIRSMIFTNVTAKCKKTEKRDNLLLLEKIKNQ